MKKVLLLFALVASMFTPANAFTIIIQGGGANNTYNYEFLNNERSECGA